MNSTAQINNSTVNTVGGDQYNYNIDLCCSHVPVAALSGTFSTFKLIAKSVKEAQASQKQLQVLACAIAQLLRNLDERYCANSLLEVKTGIALTNLQELLREISAFVQKQADTRHNFLTFLYAKEGRISQIEVYYSQLRTAVDAFQITELLNIHEWQTKNDAARLADQELLNDRFNKLEANHTELMKTLDWNQTNMIAMVTSLRQRLDHIVTGERERSFITHSLQFLSAAGGQVQLKKWTITTYNVEYGKKIGSGRFGDVYEGIWNKIPVALKVFKTKDGIVPSSASINREIDTWSRISHPHILQFLGANTLDNKPFLVTPYLKNGNAWDYVLANRECNRLALVRDVSRGLVYLHSEQVIHGDLKAKNVLIDDDHRAVLCDFGLSCIMADITSQTNKSDSNIVEGSRNWMAPELLQGGSLQKSTDIYALGMVIYEIYTGRIPLDGVADRDMFEFVVGRNLRPGRRGADVALQMTDEVWRLAERCWVKDPLLRPDAFAVLQTLSSVVYTPQPSHESLDLSRAPVDLPRLSTSPANLPVHRLTGSFVYKCTVPGHIDWVWSVAFSPDGKRIASGSQDHTIRICESKSYPVSSLFAKLTSPVYWVAFSPDGKKIASATGDHHIKLFEANTGENLVSLEGHKGLVRSIAFSPDSRGLVSTSRDNSIQMWNTENGGKPWRQPQYVKRATTVAFSKDGKRVVSGMTDKTIRVWGSRDGGLLKTIATDDDLPICTVFSPDSKQVISGGNDGTVRVWDAETGRLALQPFKQHDDHVVSVAVSPDGEWIASGSYDHTIIVWDRKSGEVVSGPLKGHTAPVWSVAFSPDGRQIVSGSHDNTVRMWTWS